MLPALSDDNFSARLFNTYSTTGGVTNNNQQHILHNFFIHILYIAYLSLPLNPDIKLNVCSLLSDFNITRL